MTYTIIDKNILEAIQLNNSLTLNEEELIKIMVNKEIISKFIRQKGISIQFDIGNGRIGTEYLKVQQEFGKLADEIDNIDNIINQYRQEEANKN